MKIDWLKLNLSLLGPLAIGFVGSLFTNTSIENWYRVLNKPELLPPDSVFGPVWTALYILMGLALYLVLVSKVKYKNKALFIFGLQLLLNLAWSLIFFRYRSPALALIEIGVLWIVILMNINIFSRYSKAAAWLLAPYLLWVSFAAYLNYSVWRLN